ncbi:MAG: hypothetical protein R8K53_03545 [Mariprofundaceae bacterium]
MPAQVIAVYISGHGYGHLAQIAPVLNALHAKKPELQYAIRSDLPVALIRHRLQPPFSLLPGAVDVGVVQKNAVSEDIPATINAAHAFYADFANKIDVETTRLQALQPALVVSDISPLAFPVAKRLNTPSIAVANLDWHDIYSDFLPADDTVLKTLQQAHGDCDMLIQPPLSMPMHSFTNRCAVELIVDNEQPLADKKENKPQTALIMFGGAGDPPFDVQALRHMPDWQFLTLSPLPASVPANVRQATLHGSTASLIKQCDLVVTKPGYGTLAECWLTGTPIAYLPRKSFAEYPYLDGWLQAHAPSARMRIEDFVNGNWRSAMQEAMNCARTYPEITASGAEQAAEMILHHLQA